MNKIGGAVKGIDDPVKCFTLGLRVVPSSAIKPAPGTRSFSLLMIITLSRFIHLGNKIVPALYFNRHPGEIC